MTQAQKVLAYLQDNGSITTLEAFVDLGVTRLASRIHELVKMGVDIGKEKIKVRTRDGGTAHVTRYFLRA